MRERILMAPAVAPISGPRPVGARSLSRNYSGRIPTDEILYLRIKIIAGIRLCLRCFWVGTCTYGGEYGCDG